MEKFERIGFVSQQRYDKGYDDLSHPEDELVIFDYGPGKGLQGIRDTYQSRSSLLQLHDILPIRPDGLDPMIDKAKLKRAHNLESMFFSDEARVYLCDSSSIGPTGSFKDPDAYVTLARLSELGYDSFVLASTGDCGVSTCFYGPSLGIDIHLFIPEGFHERFDSIMQQVSGIDHDRINIYCKGADMHEAFYQAVGFAHENHYPHDYFFKNQLRVEGNKVIHVGVIEELGMVPDYYVQALGSGTGLFSMWKATYDLGLRRPQLVGIQPDGCCPMVRAYEQKDIKERSDTHVLGIDLTRVTDAYPYLCELKTRFLSVYEGGKRSERQNLVRDMILLEQEGIVDPGLEACLAVSGLEKLADEIKKEAIEKKRPINVVLGITGKLREFDKVNLFKDK